MIRMNKENNYIQNVLEKTENLENTARNIL